MRWPEDFIGKIINADCLEIMKEIPDKSVDFIVTSPPYNLLNSTGNGMKYKSGTWDNAAIRSGYDGYSDNIPYKDYVLWQQKCLNEMLRIINNNGAIFYNHKWRVQNRLLQNREDIIKNFPVRQIIIWKKNNCINYNPYYFLPSYEVIYLIAKRNFIIKNNMQSFGDVWHCPSARNNPHPAPFPIKLVEKILLSTGSGIILDPFAGSGTTGLAAERLGFKNWILIEQSKKYCEMAEQRINQEKAQLKLFEKI